VLSHPKKGSLEWHKKEYAAIANSRVWNSQLIKTDYITIDRGRTSLDRCRDMWNRVRGKPIRWRPLSEQELEKLAGHEKALIELGYFERREFCVTNNLIGNLPERIARATGTAITNWFWTLSRGDQSNIVIVVGAREDMPAWEKLVKKIDSQK
jgi:hypothetical protein